MLIDCQACSHSVFLWLFEIRLSMAAMKHGVLQTALIISTCVLMQQKAIQDTYPDLLCASLGACVTCSWVVLGTRLRQLLTPSSKFYQISEPTWKGLGSISKGTSLFKFCLLSFAVEKPNVLKESLVSGRQTFEIPDIDSPHRNPVARESIA